ncbi:MAG: efflux RND transporter periplasmic adaptor subunit, partial [Desulfobacterales bacterium]|nr:efflux RND transporter periplasmic adaptor subunit [Desulfobacterales bacterium]
MSVEIVPQVSGQIVHLAPEFIAGGFFNQGDLLFEIEPADYQLVVERNKASVAKAEYDLAQVESQARVARLEWKRIRMADKQKPNPLVLFEPQLKNARFALAAARADLRQRQLDLERTKLYAPFNCRVRSETVDPGQYLTAGKAVALVSGTDTAEIVLPVPLHDLQWLRIPRGGSPDGSPATVSIEVGDRVFEWSGRIVRGLGEVDAKGRRVRLVVSVPDPYGLQQRARAAAGLDLTEGLFVKVSLAGATLTKVFRVPVGALRDDDTLWVMNPDSLLEIRRIQVLRRERDVVLVRGDLQDGERLIRTRLSGAAPGMKLRAAAEA